MNIRGEHRESECVYTCVLGDQVYWVRVSRSLSAAAAAAGWALRASVLASVGCAGEEMVVRCWWVGEVGEVGEVAELGRAKYVWLG